VAAFWRSSPYAQRKRHRVKRGHPVGVLRVRGDLRDRIDDLSRGYQEPYRALHAAAADIDRAHSGVAMSRDGLSSPQGPA
jgi:hypothetical protein